MKYGINLELTYEYKRFYFDSRSSTFKHNETGLTRKVVLDYFGNKLKSYAVKINDTKFLKGAHDDFNELFGILYQDKIGPNEPDRKYFIKKYQQIADDITIKILSNPDNINDDFDFDELDEMPQLNLDDEATGTLTDDFDFDEIEITLPAAGTEKPITKVDEFDFSEFDENESTKLENSVSNIKTTINEFDTSFDTTLEDEYENEDEDEDSSIIGSMKPYFHFSNSDYRLSIHFNYKSFSATGPNSDIVYALQNLATLVFINYEFLTAQKHPEWLYSSFNDDLKMIFDNLSTQFSYTTQKEKDKADEYIYTSMYLAVLNYRNRLGYYKHHKPFVFEHE